jgi:peptide/nickel transport system substrate-binding protein
LVVCVTISRRDFNFLTLAGLGAGAGLALSGLAACSRGGSRAEGKYLVFGQPNEPTQLNSAISTAAPATFVATKIFEPLVGYDLDGKPTPRLAVKWEVSPDGLTYRFDLQPGVLWHDGKPFTSADVAYSLLEIWKKYHARGRTTFANVERVDSPEPLVSIWHLSQPAPYLLSSLGVTEATVLPRHLYAGKEVLTNPQNVAPIGNGPFRFKTWERGNSITLERNEAYWQKDKPLIDGIVVRFLPDATSTAIALETGTIDLASGVPFSEVPRLKGNETLRILEETASLSPGWSQVEFNLDRKPFGDVRVRQAVAHAIDRAFIAKNILGNAQVADSPVPAELREFHAAGLPSYPFDLDKARALLDAAGLRPDASGVRLRATVDFSGSASNTRIASHMRSTLAKVGIDLRARAQDQGEYINRVYTRRDFDLCMTGSGAGRDPAIGVQRYYWSRNILPGVAFSNGPHYRNTEVDRLLEAAQVELDPAKRRALYAQFQRIAMTDLPYIPLVFTHAYVGSSARVGGLLTELGGVNTNFRDVTLSA